MTQEEFNQRYAEHAFSSELDPWPYAWKFLNINTDRADHIIRVIGIDDEPWFYVTDIVSRLGFSNATVLKLYAGEEEIIKSQGMVYLTGLYDKSSSMARHGNLISTRGLAKIALQLPHVEKDMRQDYSRDNAVRFAQWLVSYCIPRAQEKLKTAPTVIEQLRPGWTKPDASSDNEQETTKVVPFVEHVSPVVDSDADNYIDQLLDVIDADIMAVLQDKKDEKLSTYGPPLPQTVTHVWLTAQLLGAYRHGRAGTVPEYWAKYERELEADWQSLVFFAEKYGVKIVEVE